jgi:hypothetical protein
MFYAVIALLLSLEKGTSKHSGAISAFALRFVRSVPGASEQITGRLNSASRVITRSWSQCAHKTPTRPSRTRLSSYRRPHLPDRWGISHWRTGIGPSPGVRRERGWRFFEVQLDQRHTFALV